MALLNSGTKRPKRKASSEFCRSNFDMTQIILRQSPKSSQCSIDLSRMNDTTHTKARIYETMSRIVHSSPRLFQALSYGFKVFKPTSPTCLSFTRVWIAVTGWKRIEGSFWSRLHVSTKRLKSIEESSPALADTFRKDFRECVSLSEYL
jgi:hypothetical protein